MPQFIFFLILGWIIRFHLEFLSTIHPTFPKLVYQNLYLLPENMIILSNWYVINFLDWVANTPIDKILPHLIYQTSEVGIAVLIYILARKLFKVTPRSALYATAVYILNPAVWLGRDPFTFQLALATFVLLLLIRLVVKRTYFISAIGLVLYIALLWTGQIEGYFYLVLPFMTITAAAAPQLWPVYLLACAGPFIPFPQEYYLTIFMTVPAIAWTAIMYDQIFKK